MTTRTTNTLSARGTRRMSNVCKVPNNTRLVFFVPCAFRWFQLCSLCPRTVLLGARIPIHHRLFGRSLNPVNFLRLVAPLFVAGRQ